MAAPALSLTTLKGEVKKIGDYQGSGLIMIFMSSWCPCSNDSIPIVKEAYMRQEGEGVKFLMIGIQEARSKFERFVDRRGIGFPAVYDSGKKISRAFGVNAPPTMVFIDADGKVTRVFYGNIKDKEKEFAAWVKEIM
ncbi:MAG: TlpA family protein disulfide reductase [Desulfobacterales bacterium]|nr:TlpA family protein disulfide reductase [Desulfobacterales bacterium]